MNIFLFAKVNNLHSGFIELVQKLQYLLIGPALSGYFNQLLHKIHFAGQQI